MPPRCKLHRACNKTPQPLDSYFFHVNASLHLIEGEHSAGRTVVDDDGKAVALLDGHDPHKTVRPDRNSVSRML